MADPNFWWYAHQTNTAEISLNDTINRVEQNDMLLQELSISDILRKRSLTLKLVRALKDNTNIKSVSFRDYGYNMDNFNTILRALTQTKVSRISVGPYSMDGIEWQSRYAMTVTQHIMTFPYLTRLDLNSCHIGPQGSITLSAILAQNTTITKLDLQDNEIGDEGAVAIGQMLKNNNRTIKEIILDNNEFTPYGQRALRDAIFDDSSFDAMQRSNHVLQSYFYNPRSVFGRSVMNDVLSSHAANLRSKYSETAVTKKLVRMLKRKYGVRLHFETCLGMETEVLPLVLGWLADKCDLTMMYEFRPILLNLLEGRRG